MYPEINIKSMFPQLEHMSNLKFLGVSVATFLPHMYHEGK